MFLEGLFLGSIFRYDNRYSTPTLDASISVGTCLIYIVFGTSNSIIHLSEETDSYFASEVLQKYNQIIKNYLVSDINFVLNNTKNRQISQKYFRNFPLILSSGPMATCINSSIFASPSEIIAKMNGRKRYFSESIW